MPAAALEFAVRFIEAVERGEHDHNDLTVVDLWPASGLTADVCDVTVAPGGSQ